jgi:hypothetical protein
MGNNTPTGSPKNLSHSFDDINNSVKPLALQETKDRFSSPNFIEKGLRKEYSNRLNKEKCKVKVDRISMRNKNLKCSVELFGKDDFDNSFLNHSLIEKPNIMEDSMIDLKSSISRNSTKIISGQNSQLGSRKNSSFEKEDKEYNGLKPNRIYININSKSNRRSLSHDQGESSTSQINALILDELLDSDGDSNKIIKHKRKNCLSSDDISKNTNKINSDEAIKNEADTKKSEVSEISNFSVSYKNTTRNQNAAYNDYELNYVKDGENLRRSYIAKLIYKKIWQPSKKEKDHNTLIIFDWDDTLLCTSFLTPNGIFNEDIELNEKEKEKITKLELSTLRLLTAAIDKGDTYIITNAAPGWVEYSAERFYPSVKTVLDKVRIISARGEYEEEYPGDSRMWKIQSFLNVQKNFDNNLVTNIICLGDSFIEMEAAHVLASKFSQAYIKTVKFKESPKPEELNKQLLLVADQFPVIYSTVKNLTIRVEKKAKR